MFVDPSKACRHVTDVITEMIAFVIVCLVIYENIFPSTVLVSGYGIVTSVFLL